MTQEKGRIGDQQLKPREILTGMAQGLYKAESRIFYSDNRAGENRRFRLRSEDFQESMTYLGHCYPVFYMPRPYLGYMPVMFPRQVLIIPIETLLNCITTTWRRDTLNLTSSFFGHRMDLRLYWGTTFLNSS